MHSFRHAVLLLGAIVACLPAEDSHASMIASTVTGGIGPFGSSLSFVNDGTVPSEGGFWQANTTYWNGNSQFITLDFGSVYTLLDLLVSVDNNDTYQLSYSINGTTFFGLATVPFNAGEVGGGMDTFSSVIGNPEYYSGIDIAPVQARYLRIQATSGDGSNSVGELQAFGDAVPEPSSLALMVLGAIGLIGQHHRQRRKDATPPTR